MFRVQGVESFRGFRGSGSSIPEESTATFNRDIDY